ncbi:MAG: GNAT family N-acetyltransferase [Proteobacteria bacterium]|nr:GNAT family N-acetyltransferase [Pseudomonadota bacterium]
MSSAGPPGITFRHTSDADLPACHAVFHASQDELHKRRNVPWTVSPFDPAGPWATLQRHLITHDGARAYVAEAGSRIVGFTAALVRGDFWFLAALFVDPAYQGKGVGARLFDLAWDRSCRRHATVTEAIQPVSNGLYARRGLLPVTPMLVFSGKPHRDPWGHCGDARRGDPVEHRGTCGEPVDARPEPATPTPEALRAIDLAAYGFDRRVDHALWSRMASSATLWLRDGEPCAYSYRGTVASLVGPVAGRDPQCAALAFRAELARTPEGEGVRLSVPGTASALVRVALDAGLRFDDPGLLLLSPGDALPSSWVPHSFWLL